MKTRTDYIHGGQCVAEVEVQRVESENIQAAADEAKVYLLTPVAQTR